MARIDNLAMHRWTIAALALAAVVVVRAQSIPQTQSAASIPGRVIDATSGQPVSGVIVRLEPEKQTPILTGPDGQFVFTRLSPGLYRLRASKPGYLDSAYGQMRARGQGTMLLLAEGGKRDDAVIRMWPWGTITGTVVDDDGKPVVGIGVQVWRRGPNGRLDTVALSDPLSRPEVIISDDLRRSVPSRFTDAEGRYAIHRLPPGRYAVGITCGTFGSATRETVTTVATFAFPVTQQLQLMLSDRGGSSFTATSSCVSRFPPTGDRARMYTSTFYADAASPAAAATIDLPAGETVSGIDFVLRSQVTSRVAGTVIGIPQLLAGTGGSIRLLPPDWQPRATMNLHQVSVRSDGTFVFVAVMPGTYAIAALPQDRYWIDQLVTVENDIDDLVVTARPGVKIAGQIQTESTPAGQLHFAMTLNNRNYTVQANASGGFVLNDLVPGTHIFSPTTTTSEWQLVSATLDGRDVLGTMIDIGPKDMAGLVLHFSDRPGSIAGNVIDPRGTSSSDASVVLFPADPAVWSSARDDSPIFRSVRTWAGHYVLERIPNGEYVLAAVDDGALEEWPDATLLSRIAAVGQRMRVATGQQLQRDLRVEIGIR